MNLIELYHINWIRIGSIIVFNPIDTLSTRLKKQNIAQQIFLNLVQVQMICPPHQVVYRFNSEIVQFSVLLNPEGIFIKTRSALNSD